MKNIVLVTSIAPKDMDNQKRALDTWINAGFRIISCNVKEELELVQKNFPQVEFVEMERHGGEVIGKPCPYIYDMLLTARENADEICGIVNSDIYLYKFDANMYTYIYKQAKEHILFMRRNDVDSLDDVDNLEYDMFFGGIDVFIFNKNAVDIIEDDGLLLGQAMWDYWLPIMFAHHGMQVREFTNPVIFHIKHAVRWSDDVTADISWKICTKHFPKIEKENAVFFLKDNFFSLISKVDIGICSVSDKTAEKTVLLVCGAKEKEELEKKVVFQTHRYITVSDSVEGAAGYDYVILMPYIPVLCSCFIDTLLWVMENYDVPAISIMTYVRGNRTNALHIDNCCSMALKRLNRELKTITVWKSSSFFDGAAAVKLCTTYVCSICIQENEEIIWERDGFGGRTLVYPAGYMARLWVRRYKEIDRRMQIVGFADSSASMQNTLAEGLPVYAPDIILQQDQYDKIVIVSNLYQEEIYNMLRKKVKEEKLVVWNEFSLKNVIHSIRG